MNTEELKISVPIMTNLEIEELDYNIRENYESIFDKVTKTVSKDREIIILQRIIKNQDEQIKMLRNLLDKRSKLL